MFMFACSFAFMFACTFAFAFAGLAAGLGEAVTLLFALPVFVLSAVLQAAKKAATLSKASKPMIRRIEIPPTVHQEISAVKVRGRMYALLSETSLDG